MPDLPEGFAPLPDDRSWYWRALYALATFLDHLVSHWPYAARRLTFWVNSRFEKTPGQD